MHSPRQFPATNPAVCTEKLTIVYSTVAQSDARSATESGGQWLKFRPPLPIHSRVNVFLAGRTAPAHRLAGQAMKLRILLLVCLVVLLSGCETTYYLNGDKYVGDTKKSQRHGWGRYYYANGDVYEGEFRNNKLNGRGTVTFANGNQLVAEFTDNRPASTGTLLYPNGDRYDGDIRNGKAHGQGIYTYADGSRYVGPVKNDLPHGKGSIYYANGDRYSGELYQGRYQGLGRKSFGEDRVPLEGRWEAGSFVRPERMR